MAGLETEGLKEEKTEVEEIAREDVGNSSDASDWDPSVHSHPQHSPRQRGQPTGWAKHPGTTTQRQHRGDGDGSGRWLWVKCYDTVQEIVEKEGYCSRRVFSASHMHLDWKAKPMESCFSFKKTKHPKVLVPSPPDILTIFLCANVEGDMRLPPLIVYPKEPSPEVKAASPSLVWEIHSEATVTPEVYSKWLETHFAPTVSKYCRKNGLEEKVLLVVKEYLLDPLLPPPPAVVKVTPLMPFSTHPIDGVADSVQSQFSVKLMTLYCKLLLKDESEEVLKEFWMNFNLEKAITMFSEIWKSIWQRILQEAWRKGWPEGVPPPPSLSSTPARKKTAAQGKKSQPCTSRKRYKQQDTTLCSSSSSSSKAKNSSSTNLFISSESSQGSSTDVPTQSSGTSLSITDPKTTQPTTARPKTTQPTTPRPKTTQPTTPCPKTTQPTTPRPKTTQPTTPRPKTTQPTTPRPKTTQPTTPRLKTAQPTTPRPKTTQPTTAHPKTTQLTTPRPKTTQPTTPRPKTAQPTTPRPKTTQPTTTYPKTTQPTTTHPKTTQPTTTYPKTTQPLPPHPRVTQLSAPHPRATQPMYIATQPLSTSLIIVQPPSNQLQSPLTKQKTIQTTFMPNQPSLISVKAPYIIPDVSDTTTDSHSGVLSLSPHASTTTDFHTTDVDPLCITSDTSANIILQSDVLPVSPHASANAADHITDIDPLSITSDTSTNLTFQSRGSHLYPLFPTPITSTHNASFTPLTSPYSGNTPDLAPESSSKMPCVKPTVSSLMPVSSSQVYKEMKRLLMKATLIALRKDPDLGRSTRLCLEVMKAL